MSYGFTCQSWGLTGSQEAKTSHGLFSYWRGNIEIIFVTMRMDQPIQGNKSLSISRKLCRILGNMSSTLFHFSTSWASNNYHSDPYLVLPHPNNESKTSNTCCLCSFTMVIRPFLTLLWRIMHVFSLSSIDDFLPCDRLDSGKLYQAGKGQFLAFFHPLILDFFPCWTCY